MESNDKELEKVFEEMRNEPAPSPYLKTRLLAIADANASSTRFRFAIPALLAAALLVVFIVPAPKEQVLQTAELRSAEEALVDYLVYEIELESDSADLFDVENLFLETGI